MTRNSDGTQNPRGRPKGADNWTVECPICGQETGLLPMHIHSENCNP